MSARYPFGSVTTTTRCSGVSQRFTRAESSSDVTASTRSDTRATRASTASFGSAVVPARAASACCRARWRSKCCGWPAR